MLFVAEDCKHKTFWNKNPNQNHITSILDFGIQGRPSNISDADEESRRMATRSTWNNSGAASSSSSSTSTTLRIVASTITEPTLNMPTTPAQLIEMIASAVATALKDQQPTNRDLFNPSNSGSSRVASIWTENKNLGGHIMRPAIHEVPANLYRQTSSITNEALKRNRLSDFNTDNSKRKTSILIILKSEDLLTLISKVRLKPIKSLVPLEEVLNRPLASAGAAPMNRTVKIHSMESKTVTPICFWFQVNKCPFGDKCKYRHIKDENFIPRENKENKNNNGADKKKITPKIPNRKFTPNNNNNRLVGPPRGKSLDGQAPTYSTMQIRTSKLLANVNTVNENDDNNKVIVSNDVLTTRGNYSSMFDNNSSTFTNSQARISTFNYTSSSSTSSSSTSSSSAPTCDQLTAHIWNYDVLRPHME